MSPKAPPESLVALLEVYRHLGQAESAQGVAFIAVNEAHALTPYRQAVLWSRAHGVEAVSGLAMPEQTAPFVLWLVPLCRWLAARHQEPTPLTAHDVPAALETEWSEWLPVHGLWVPLGPEAGLFYARPDPWTAGDIALLRYLGEAVAAWRRPYERRVRFFCLRAGLGLGSVLG